MGMDLKPINPSKDAPRYPSDDKYSPNDVIWGRYNWSGWSYICNLLNEWGVNTSEFSGMNDGEVISEETCKKVADAIEAHLDELDKEHREWLKDDIALWRTCGGYRQY